MKATYAICSATQAVQIKPWPNFKIPAAHSARFWTAAGSGAPRRFRAGESYLWFAHAPCVRKRCRRCALPPQSKTLARGLNAGLFVPATEFLESPWPSVDGSGFLKLSEVCSAANMKITERTQTGAGRNGIFAGIFRYFLFLSGSERTQTNPRGACQKLRCALLIGFIFRMRDTPHPAR